MAAPQGPPKIPGYEILAPVGKGGMGTVFKARQLSMDRPVAVKLLSPKLAKNRGFIDQFVREARATAKLAHPNIILGIDAGEVDGQYYFVMEFVEGRPLKAIMKERGALPEREALGIARQVAEALDHAYRNAIVHRDVKPGNIMVTPDGTAKVCDMGLAARPGESGDALSGTPYYMSPEQTLASADLDVRTDLYSLGATLFHMVTGKPPFDAERAEQIIEMHRRTPPPNPRDVKPDVSRRTAELILKLMEKDRMNRHQTPRELSKDIAAAIEVLERGPQKPRRSVAERYAKRGSLVPLVVLFLLLTVSVFAYVFRDKWIPYLKGKFQSAPSPVAPQTPQLRPEDAERELQALRDRAASDVDFAKSREIDAALDAFVRTYGPVWRGPASEVRRAYREALDAYVPPGWRGARARAATAAAAGKWGEAWWLYRQFPAAFAQTTRAGREAAEAAAEAGRHVEIQFSHDADEFTRLMDAHRFDDADAALERMAAYAAEEMLRGVDLRRAELASARDAQRRAWEARLNEEVGSLDAEVRLLLSQRKTADAARRVSRFLAEDRPADARAQLRDSRVDYERVARAVSSGDWPGLVATCERGLADISDVSDVTPAQGALLLLRNAAEIECLLAELDGALGGWKAATFSVNGWGVTPAVGSNPSAELPVAALRKGLRSDLPTPVVEAILLRHLRPDPEDAREALDHSGRRLGQLGLFCFYSGRAEDFARSRELLGAAAERGYPGAALYTIDVVALRRGREASRLSALWANVGALKADGRWTEAQRAVEELLASADVPFVAERRDEIERELESVVPKADVMRTLERRLKGRLMRYHDGLATIEYDFSRREQVEAFQVMNGARNAAGWTWDKSGWLASSGAIGSALRWSEPFEGDVVVEYVLRSLEQKNIATTLYFNPGESKHYSFYFGLDLVMGAKLDPYNTVEREHDLPRHGIAKFPLPDPAGNWQAPEFWGQWRDGLIGKPATELAMERGRAYRVRIERAAAALRLFVDGAEVAIAEDGEYASGSLVFYNDARVRISDLRITWRIDP